MNPTLILVDVSCIAYRTMHVVGDFEYQGEGTAVAFGVLRNILEMKELFPGCLFAFAFDGGNWRRQEIAPEYKMKRKQRTEEEQATYRKIWGQIDQLKEEVLPSIGFRKIWQVDGYEADDLIAMACCVNAVAGSPFDIVIVSTDQDLYQLLRPNVQMFSPASKKVFTEVSFRKKYGISPEFWSRVKAWAGCTSDGLKGVEGVGEKTAIKFMLGELPDRHKISKKFLLRESWDLFNRNLRVVELPMEGCPAIELVDDEWSQTGWDAACDKMGLSTLRDRARGVRGVRKRKKKVKKCSFGL